MLDVSISKSLSLSAYSQLGHAVTHNTGDGATFKKKVLQRGDRTVFWLGGELSGALPKDAKQGDLLVGKLEVQGGEKKADGTLYSIAWIVPPESKAKEESAGNGQKEPPKDDAVLLKEATRDLQISWLGRMKKDDAKETLLKQLEGEYSNHLPLYQAKLDLLLEAADKADKNGSVPDDLSKQIVGAAEKILELVDEKELAIYHGTKHDLSQGGEKETNLKKEMDKQKEAVVAAYGAKGTAIKDLIANLEREDRKGASRPAPTSPYPSIAQSTSIPTDVNSLVKIFDDSLSRLAKWLAEPPTNDGKYLLLWSWRQCRKGFHCTALKALNKFIGDVKNVSAEGEVWKRAVGQKREVVKELGWGVWEKYEDRWAVVKAPKDFAPF